MKRREGGVDGITFILTTGYKRSIFTVDYV